MLKVRNLTTLKFVLPQCEAHGFEAWFFQEKVGQGKEGRGAKCAIYSGEKEERANVRKYVGFLFFPPFALSGMHDNLAAVWHMSHDPQEGEGGSLSPPPEVEGDSTISSNLKQRRRAKCSLKTCCFRCLILW